MDKFLSPLRHGTLLSSPAWLRSVLAFLLVTFLIVATLWATA